jgi:hypothetical protein
VLDKEKKCTYANTNAIIGLLMCTAAWINVKVSPVIAATSMSEKCKGDRKRRPQVQKQVNGTPIEALVDSGASVRVMSEKAFKTVWEHWKMQRLPILAALTVSGVNSKKIDVTGYVEIPLTIKDGKTDEVRSFTRLVLVLSGIGQAYLILGYDFIQEEGMVIDGAANETYFADRRAEGGDTWQSASLCCLRRTTILPKTITHVVVGTVTQGGDRVQAGAVALCTAIHGSTFGIWDSACTVDEHGQVVVAIVNMTNDRFDLVLGDCVGAMSNSVFKADGGIYKLNDESVNTIFGNIGKVPEDPKWGEGPPLKQKEKKVLKEQLQVLGEEPWRQQYIDLMLRYHDICSKDKFNLDCADVIEHSIVMEEERPVHQRQFRVPFAHEEVLYEYVDKLLKSGAIEFSRSPYNSAVFCVAKKQLPNAVPGDPVPLRVVLDFRAVNLKSLPDCYCVKEVRECLEEVDKAKLAIFSTFDLTSGFWQQSLQEKSRQYTAFSVPGKRARYQWRVTPMGLQGSPASFARLMDFVMTGVKGIIMYIDDILEHSRDHEQHLKSIEEVLWRLRKYGLKLNVDKTIIGARTVQYLGYTLSGQGVTLSKDKIAAIKDFPMPTSPKALRKFLGLKNYFRLLIPRFSQTADPLNKMTRASTVWRTGAPPLPEAQAAFNKLRR